jgi:hypothetical protein
LLHFFVLSIGSGDFNQFEKQKRWRRLPGQDNRKTILRAFRARTFSRSQVKAGKARDEQMFSALPRQPPEADIAQHIGICVLVPNTQTHAPQQSAILFNPLARSIFKGVPRNSSCSRLLVCETLRAGSTVGVGPRV